MQLFLNFFSFFLFCGRLQKFLKPFKHHNKNMNDCIFCKIITKQIPAEIIYENDSVISILDIHPVNYGHALVIPKNHCKDFLDIPKNQLEEIMHTGQIVANALIKSFQLQGFNIFANNGAIAGQSVFHFHLHILPRYPNDNVHFHTNLKKYEGDFIKKLSQKIQSNISLS